MSDKSGSGGLVSFRAVYPGVPKPQARARHGRSGAVFTPKDTREAQGSLKAYLQERGSGLMVGPVHLCLVFYFPAPKSWPRWKCDWANTHETWHTSRPDADNLVKLVKDAASGVLWVDDRQVARLEVRKLYTLGAPRTVIEVSSLEALPATKPKG